MSQISYQTDLTPSKSFCHSQISNPIKGSFSFRLRQWLRQSLCRRSFLDLLSSPNFCKEWPDEQIPTFESLLYSLLYLHKLVYTKYTLWNKKKSSKSYWYQSISDQYYLSFIVVKACAKFLIMIEWVVRKKTFLLRFLVGRSIYGYYSMVSGPCLRLGLSLQRRI